MTIKGNKKRILAAAIAIAGLAGGVVAVHAETFSQRKLAVSPAPPSVFPSIPDTCAADCDVYVDAGWGSVQVGDVSLDGGFALVPTLGFSVSTESAAAAQSAEHTLAGGSTSTIKVREGTTVTIHLSQDGNLDPIDLSFPSLPIGSTGVVDNHDTTYTVVANKVGTSVFQPGSNPDAPRQVAMGLVGVLIVSPASCSTCAYSDTPAFTDEAIVATTDLDFDFATDFRDHNFQSGLRTFDMSYFGQAPNPDGSARDVYHVINGKSFPDTDVIDAQVNDIVLLRYVNAGVTDKTMGLLGLRQTLLGRNASKYTDAQTFVAPLVGPGETADVIVTVPDTAPVEGQLYSLMDQGRQMNHGTSSGFGGALTFLEVWPTVVPAINVATVQPEATTTTTTTTIAPSTTTTVDSTTTTADSTTTTTGA